MNFPELNGWVALASVDGIGPITAKKLVAFAGGIENVFCLTRKDLSRIPGTGVSTLNLILSAISGPALEEANTTIEQCASLGITIIPIHHPDYPKRLKLCEDSPIILFKKGHGDLNPERAVAVVGTRNMTRHGAEFIEHFIADLVPPGIQVISGMAYGVDIEAHRRALKCGLSTVGVLANGLDILYPSAHKASAVEMLEKGGLVSEFKPGMKPVKDNFPARNRLVAGMADATIIIESDVSGGSMITAMMAHGYNRDLFAVPGRPGDRYSAGCNRLISDQRAAMLRNAADLIKAMQWSNESLNKVRQTALFIDLEPEELVVAQYLRSHGRSPIDKLAVDLSVPISKCSAMLLELEFKGAVRSLPGKMYEAC